jgi:hypothetical protein
MHRIVFQTELVLLYLLRLTSLFSFKLTNKSSGAGRKISKRKQRISGRRVSWDDSHTMILSFQVDNSKTVKFQDNLVPRDFPLGEQRPWVRGWFQDGH